MTMNRLSTRAQAWLGWLLPFVLLALVIGWESDWGMKWRHVPVTDGAVVPQPVTIAVLPEYAPTATLATQHDIIDRTLFNATRRPAPVLAAAAAKPRLQPGQFLLTGTMIIDGKATAFLKENAGGKSRRVAQGEQVNGMLVAEVKPDRVKLTLGDESEDLVLKVASGPKTTTQPVAAVAPGPAGTSVLNAAGAAGTPIAPSATDVLTERRRAQQAAETAANAAANAGGGRPFLNNAAPGTVLPPPGTATVNAPVDPRWAESDARIRARVQGPNMKPGQ